MAGKKISELDIIARALSGEEMIPVAFEEQNYRITPEQIREYVEAAMNTFTTTQTIKVTYTNIPIVMNYAASGATDVFVRLQLEGVNKGAVGYSTTAGTYLYNYEGTNFLGLFRDGAYVGKGSTKEKVATETTVDAKVAALQEKITALEARIATLEGGQL